MSTKHTTLQRKTSRQKQQPEETNSEIKRKQPHKGNYHSN